MQALSIFNPSSALEIIFTVLGGLGMFLFGIEFMSSSLKSLSGNKLKLLIEKTTNNLFMGILTGMFVTVLIQSSSATTVIVIGLISAGLMTLKQAIGVMMGANIGTTVTAFLVGLSINEYSLIFVAIGAIIFLFISRKNIKLIGGVILGFGLLFAGLEFMSLGLVPIKDQPWFSSAMVTLSNNSILGVLTGTILTAVVQSSSAAIAVVQQVFSEGGIPLRGAITILIGSNIGSTVTAILASLSAPRDAKQASLFHLLFNAIGAVIVLIFLNPFVGVFENLEANILGPNKKITLAFVHIAFNLVTTIIVSLIVPYVVKIIEKVLPTKADDTATLSDKLSSELVATSPVLALQSVKPVVIELGELTIEMMETAKLYQNEDDEKLFNKVAQLEDAVDTYEESIHDYLMEIQSTQFSKNNKTLQIVLLDIIKDFERIGDHAVNLTEFYKIRHELNCPFSGILGENLENYFNLVMGQVNDAVKAFKTNSISLANKIIEVEREIDRLEKVYRRSQLLDKNNNLSDCNDIHFVDILSNLERISDHCNNIAYNIIDPNHLNKERLNPSI